MEKMMVNVSADFKEKLRKKCDKKEMSMEKLGGMILMSQPLDNQSNLAMIEKQINEILKLLKPLNVVFNKGCIEYKNNLTHVAQDFIE